MPKQKMCVFTIAWKNEVGLVSQKKFLFCEKFLNGNDWETVRLKKEFPGNTLIIRGVIIK